MKTYPKHIKIGEHLVPLPPLPKDKRSILNIDKKRGDSIWERIAFPDIWYGYQPGTTKRFQRKTIWDNNEEGVLLAVSEADTLLLDRLLEEDLNRRINGVHCKIDDQIVWIAPDYYHNLQWCEMKDLPEKFGSFRWIQNDVLILWWAVRELWSTWCAGLMVPKAKKTGITQIASGAFLNELTTQEGFEMGCASKEYLHARDVFMAYLFHSYDNMPAIIRPEAKKRNLGELALGQAPQRAGSKKAVGRRQFNLNSRIVAYKTKSNCFDGPVLRRGFIDELPKWWESSSVHPDTVLVKNVEAVKLQDKINGQLLIGSYMPEVDDLGFYEFVEWVKKSMLKTVNKATGRTQSNLIMFPMTAVESYESCFDKFGRCNQRRAYELVTQELDSKPRLSDKMAFRRQYPRDLNDMFDAGGRGTTFDNIRLARFHRDTKSLMESGVTPWKYCRLHWDNAEWNEGLVKRPAGKFSLVDVEEMTEEDIVQAKHEDCEFRIHYDGDMADLMPYFNQVIQRKHFHEEEEEEVYCPLPDDQMTPMGGSWDPVEYALKREVTEASTNSGWVGWVHDSGINHKFERIITRAPLIEYYFRHDDPDEDYENLVKLILLTGCRILVEGNKTWVVTKLRKDKLHHFLVFKYPDGSIRPYQIGDEDIKPVSASPQMINDYIRAIKRMWRQPRLDGEVDYMQLVQSPLLYEQSMKFDPTDTKKFDHTVSYGWYCLCLESLSYFFEETQDESDMYSEKPIQQAFDNLLNA